MKIAVIAVSLALVLSSCGGGLRAMTATSPTPSAASSSASTTENSVVHEWFADLMAANNVEAVKLEDQHCLADMNADLCNSHDEMINPAFPQGHVVAHFLYRLADGHVDYSAYTLTRTSPQGEITFLISVTVENNKIHTESDFVLYRIPSPSNGPTS
jgi:hypothetical protein